LWQAGAIEVAAGIRDRRFSCSEVMASVVERIRLLNPRLNFRLKENHREYAIRDC
jgi:Asp-tRNA(Asn)/Glu-tRNA(Gln) amidotransferase A subunit family amidase